jgi:hypothetical protein
MYSPNFEHLIHSHPGEAQALSRVADFLSGWEAKGKSAGDLRLTPTRLAEIAKVADQGALTQLILLLLSEHVLDRFLVVISPAGGGIAEYKSIAEIPPVIHDTLRDVDMEVSPADLQTYYRVREAT